MELTFLIFCVLIMSHGTWRLKLGKTEHSNVCPSVIFLNRSKSDLDVNEKPQNSFFSTKKWKQHPPLRPCRNTAVSFPDDGNGNENGTDGPYSVRSTSMATPSPMKDIVVPVSTSTVTYSTDDSLLLLLPRLLRK